MKLKKTLAGVMAFAMTATMLPGSIFAVPETVEAAADIETVSLPEAKYEMALDGNLDVTKMEDAEDIGVSCHLKGSGGVMGGIYDGDTVYGNDRNSGQALSTANSIYGLVLDNVAVDSTYTLSVWVYSENVIAANSPIFSVSNSSDVNNWLTVAGADNGAYKIWNGAWVDDGSRNYPLNSWVNLTLAVDGTTATVYENGQEVFSYTNDASAITSDLKQMLFGVNYWDDIPNCLFDDIRIYDETLTASQAQALYAGTTLTLSAASEFVRPGKTIELTADIISTRDDITVEWSTESEYATVDNEGVVTGVSEGTAEITATAVSGEEVLASDTLEIKVVPQGELIAEFTFDEEASEFNGTGAVAAKNNPEDSNYVKVVTDDAMGSVLQFNNTASAGEGNWLNVTKEDGSSLLADTEEFTVSYDSNSNGAFMNCWTFFADNQGGIAGERHYIGIADYPGHLEVERGTPLGQSLVTGEAFSGWKHIDVVFGSDYTDIYIDGNLCASADNTRLVTELLGNDSFVLIGKSTWGNEYWNGMLDNYRIYNYALTAEEVMTEYRDLDYHPAVDATCTTDGNIEYWTDADGNYYLDAAGEIPTTADEVKVDATGHNYGQPTWEWMKSEDGSTYTAATATFICEKGDDTQQVTDEEVTHVIENGQVIYSAEVTFGEQSYETTTTASLVLTATEEVPATCTEAGTKAYWTDQFGNRYLDAEGQSSVTDDEELVIPATGHDYISSGRWTATEEGYSLDVTFTCKHGDDTATVPAKVTSSSSDGVTVYTAVAEHNGTQFTYTKEVQDSYALTVVDGTIEGTEVTTNNYGYNDVVTVVAEKMKDGQYFEGWYIGDTLVSGNPVYSFCIVEDKTLTARYSSEEAEERAVVSLRMSDREDIGSGAERVVMTVEWSVPSDYTMIGAGLVRSYTESSEDMLTLEHVDGSSIRQNQTKAWCKNGYYKYTLNMSPTTKLNPVNARGYLIYEDAEGAEYTIYTDVFVSPVTQ